MYNLRILYIFKEKHGSSVRFSEYTEYFPEILIAALKSLQNVKLKLFILSLFFREKGKIKGTEN